MSINIWTDSMQHAALLGKPVLFTNWLIQRDIIPDGWYCYDLRGTHKSPSTRTTLVDHAADYHAGTVLSPIPLKHEGSRVAPRRISINDGVFFDSYSPFSPPATASRACSMRWAAMV